MNKLSGYLALGGVAIFVFGAMYFGACHKQIDVQVRPDLGKIIQKKVYPGSDITIAYIKQMHGLPHAAEAEADIVKKNAMYAGLTKDCDSMRKLAAKTSNKAERELLENGAEACSNINQKRADLLATVKFNPVEIQTNIYGILSVLKKQGMEMVGIEGGNSEKDDLFQAQKDGDLDIRAACQKQYSDDKKLRLCQAYVIMGYLKKGESAGVVFELDNTDEVLTVGLEKSEYHLPLLQSLKSGFTGEAQKITKEEYDALWQKREEYVAKVMVEKMRRSGKKFGAIVFGGGHDTTIPKHLDELKVSYVVIEPVAYTKQMAVNKARQLLN